MIHAGFILDPINDFEWPALTPDSESWQTVADMAEVLGVPEGDFLRISVPGGASRHACVKCLIPTEQVADLYAFAQGQADGGVNFGWKDGHGGTLHAMRVWLRPPVPLLWPSMGGFVVVEAVDCRYLARFRAPATPSSIVHGPQLTDDGRYAANTATGSDYSSGTPLGTMLALCQRLATAAGITVAFGSFNPAAESMVLVQGITAAWQDSPALLLDHCLAACGYVLQYNSGSGVYSVVQAGEDATILATYMASPGGFGRIKRGGVAACGDDTSGISDLFDQWNTSGAIVGSLAPQANKTSVIGATREGLRRYDNQYDPQDDQNETAPGASVSVPRPMALQSTWGRATLYGFTTLPGSETNLTGSYPWLAGGVTVANFAQAVWVRRSRIAFGRQAWNGWPVLPASSYRQTEMEFSIRRIGGRILCTTVTNADPHDWTLGNTGELNSDPAAMLTGIGNIDTQISPGGGRIVRVPPAQVRTFMARITGYVLIPGTWRWQYEWEEVEPTTADITDASRWQTSYPLTRKWDGTDGARAENGGERGNILSTEIWPGVLLADYPDATVECKPIGINAIVTMTQLSPTVFPDSRYPKPPAYAYTFCIPNAPKVTCTP